MSGRETEKDWRIVCAALRGRGGSRRRRRPWSRSGNNELEHTEVAFGLIIVEGDVQISGARRERNPGQFLEQLGGTLVGQKLGLGQVHRERRHPRTVLGGGRDPFGEGTALYPPTGTGSAHDAVLGDRALDRHLDHLAALRQQHLSANLRTATPARASAAQRDDDILVRVLDQAAGNAAATHLTSRLAPARLALRARRWFPERWVRGGRLAGVVAILGQACF